MRVHARVCFRLVFSQSLLSLDLIEDFLALKTEEAMKEDSTDVVVNCDVNLVGRFIDSVGMETVEGFQSR